MSYFQPTGNVKLVARSGYSGVGGIGGTLKDLLKGGLDLYGEKARAEGREAAYKEQLEARARAGAPSGLPGWVLPVGLGVGALVAIKMLRKKR